MIERHPDNVAASLYGGFVGTYLVGIMIILVHGVLCVSTVLCFSILHVQLSKRPHLFYEI